MTSVEVMQVRDRVSISVEGHAGFAEPGKDIVCSAVSILCYTLRRVVENLNLRGLLSEKHITFSNGAVYIDFTPRYGCEISVMEQVNAILEGFNILAENYPENVEFS